MSLSTSTMKRQQPSHVEITMTHIIMSTTRLLTTLHIPNTPTNSEYQALISLHHVWNEHIQFATMLHTIYTQLFQLLLRACFIVSTLVAWATTIPAMSSHSMRSAMAMLWKDHTRSSSPTVPSELLNTQPTIRTDSMLSCIVHHQHIQCITMSITKELLLMIHNGELLLHCPKV